MKLARYNSLQGASFDWRYLEGRPLSGYLGGELRGGHYVQKLEEEWAQKFGVKHAVACNSATSGLLIACMAAGVGPNTEVVTTPYTMSATSAAPAFLGADIVYGDIEPRTFSLSTPTPVSSNCKAIIVTNLFGHPAHLNVWRAIATTNNCLLIEDNAQAICATEYNTYAGTIGHIGIWSLNCHKHIQAGEGGICTTNDDDLALKMRMALNHAEMF